MAARQKPSRTVTAPPAAVKSNSGFEPAHPLLWALGVFSLIAAIFTWPLIFRMGSSIYGFYDHISTDLFSSIHTYFWWPEYAFATLKTSPVFTPLFAAPFGSRMYIANFTGYVMMPVALLFGPVFTNNLIILANPVLAAFGMFLLMRYLTKRVSAGIVAGIAFGFCTNMLVRSYTTFDSTQIEWIPFYTLFVIRFLDDRSWKNAILAGIFLSCNVLFAMPYYLVYLPVHTAVLLAVYAIWHIRREKGGIAGFLRNIFSRQSLGAWGKIATVFAAVLLVFFAYYKVIIGGTPMFAGSKPWGVSELAGLSLRPADYLVPHPRSLLLKGDFKETYWDMVPRPEKNADSDVAYVGYITLALALIGLFTARKRPEKWFFLAGALVAFWSTLGPSLFGLPTPSLLIHKYAPFARRILIYKVFVQFGMAGLAGLGTAFIVSKIRRRTHEMAFLGVVVVAMVLEYAVTPPFLSVNLTETPEVYRHVRDLPGNAAIIEVPLQRTNRNLYQGYPYYQTFHHKPLFNFFMGLNQIPESVRPFYLQMETPLEATSYANLAALRYLGISHLVYHLYTGTRTVQFRSFSAPPFFEANIEGLTRLYTGPRTLDGDFKSPYDYTFADLYEITAEPSPVALVFDYHSPFDQYEGHQGEDGMLEYGWYSALFDPAATFYFPLARDSRMERVMKGTGKITAVNLSEKPAAFGVQFTASARDSRTLEIRWNEKSAGVFPIGPEPATFAVAGLSIDASGTGELTITPSGGTFDYPLVIGQATLPLPSTAVFTDVRVVK